MPFSQRIISWTDFQIPQGPYLAKVNGDVHLTEVYRVYRDEAQAFTSPVVHTAENTFSDLSTPVAGLNTLSIPVPSRLYTMDLPNPRPLEGHRIAVKDLFDMAGLQTGGGSRAYFNTYPAKEATAVAIQHLVDQVRTSLIRLRLAHTHRGPSLSVVPRPVNLPMAKQRLPTGLINSLRSILEEMDISSPRRHQVDLALPSERIPG